MKKSLIVFLLFAVCACASHTGVVPMAENTYMIAKQQATGFPGLGNMKAEIIAEGTRYCAGLGKKFLIISTQETQPPYILGNYPRVEIQFMCLAADDTELQRHKLQKTPEKKTPKEHRALTGTGFAVSSRGTLVTAYHVVEGANNIQVKFPGEHWMPVVLVRYSRSTDVAILQIANSPSVWLSLKSTNTLEAGDSVFTMGFPVVELLGTEAKYTDGKISSLSGIKGEDSLMQISVPVQPGNSGGPLVTSDGYVVGLITSTAAVKYFYATTETLPQNINWAVKADYILPMLGEGDLEGSEIKIDNPVQKVSKAICLVKAE